MSLEHDVTNIMEADVFKPASKEEVNKRQEARRKEIEAKRLAGAHVCPECGEDLYEVGIYSVESVADQITRTFEWDKEKKEWSEVDTSRNEDDGQADAEDWYCNDCSALLQEGEDFTFYQSVKEADVFKPAEEEELLTRPGWAQAEAQRKKAAEKAAELERQNVLLRAERAKDPWKFDNTGTAKKGRSCATCNKILKKGESFFKVNYQGRYGSNHKAICKDCVNKALQKLNTYDEPRE